MIVALLILLCLALVGLLVYRERVARGDREAAQALRHAIERDRAEERQEAAQERRELYQRIQAPETAVIEHVRRERGPYQRRKPVGADDDAAFAERSKSG
jgi:Tfp pilus assembly protein PilE